MTHKIAYDHWNNEHFTQKKNHLFYWFYVYVQMSYSILLEQIYVQITIFFYPTYKS